MLRISARRSLLATGVSVCALLAAPAFADEAPAPAAAPDNGIAEGSDIVVSGTQVNEIAPTTASLQARQPQSIVSRSLIEDSLPATADFDQIALITPSVSNNGGNNGVGLSESKAQIRGFQDGEYNITYDGVPFGDTNDPTHHSTTFFPSNTIETLVVDRGPGNASQLGQATFGGNMNLFSRVARDDFGGQLKGSFGSWNTYLGRALLNTGEIGQTGIKGVFTGQYAHTDGALSYEKYQNYNLFGKVEVPFSPDVKLTLLGTYNKNKFNQPDKDGSTLYQQSHYGKYFSLNDDPTTPQYYGYNQTHKTTDFEIATLEADFAPGAKFTNQAYTYYYDNETLSASDVTGATKNTTTNAAGKTITGDVPGYTKTNLYRVYGDIMKVKLPITSFATLTGGAWIEWSHTYRQQTDVDLTTGGFNYVEKKVTAPATGLNPGAVTPLYVKFNQNSAIAHGEEFAELEIRPLPGLSITPGFKHVEFTRKIDALYNQTTRYAQRLSNTYQANLPYVQANWMLLPSLSAYFEYAQGFLAPSLTTLYVDNPSLSTAAPERSRNYQTGIVYHGPKLSLDFDVYKIDFTNKVVASTINDPTSLYNGQTVYENIGGATYKGVEGQVAYAITRDIAVFANGSINYAKDTTFHLQIANAPKSTAAAGVIVKHGPFKFSVIDKYTGPQYEEQAVSATDPLYPLYRIKGYNGANLAVSYEVGPFRLGLEVTNLLDSQRPTLIGPSSKTPITAIGTSAANNYDQYYYQAPRSITGDVTFTF